MTEVNQAAPQQRDRSPAFPVVALDTAVQRLAEFEAHFKRSAARSEKVGDAWKITTKAYADRIAAALRYFGLLEYQGVGKERSVVVSEEGRNYLLAQQEATKQEIIKRAALRPKQIAIFWNLWGKDRPADAACIDELVQKHGFSVAGAHDFLKVYDATITYAKLSDSDKSSLEEADSEEESEQSGMTQQVHTPPKPGAGSQPPIPPASPLRVVMNGDRLDIQASVDLEGLKKLRTMLEKYEGILEMMQPDKDEAAN
ncbi:MAG: hypothetical protein WB760_10980 [Xanthobacteraceae bacterium]